MDQKARVILGDSRCMRELGDGSVHLVVTSPPYWHIKDYGSEEQIGHGQTLHAYLKDLHRTWEECYRVLRDGRRLCVNVGDQFARATVYGRYKIIPIHAEVIAQCESLGFDFMGSIVWQKRTTMNTTGGANVMGSFPYPPNGMIEIDYEHILIFKKPGSEGKVPREAKEGSMLTKEEWKGHFSGHWRFGGSRQVGHEAMFPEELHRRLIKMFTFKGELVLDPFVGSGTTLKAALDLERRGVGYEVNAGYLGMIRDKLGDHTTNVIIERRRGRPTLKDTDYVPRIKDARPLVDPGTHPMTERRFFKVVEIIDHRTLRLSDGRKVRLTGVERDRNEKGIEYLREYVLGKRVYLKKVRQVARGSAQAEVFLKNGISVKKGISRCDG